MGARVQLASGYMASLVQLTPGAMFAGEFRIVRPLSEGGGSIPLDKAASTRRAQARAQLFGALATIGADADPIPGGSAPQLCRDDQRRVSPQYGAVPLLQLMISGNRVGL